jgi:hypothetical protein
MKPRRPLVITASLIREVSQRETPDVCLHFGIDWRALKPSRQDGRLHATCACGAHVTRSPFPKGDL